MKRRIPWHIPLVETEMSTPTIKDLEAFYWVARLGTVQAAADKLYITQPALTKRLRTVEMYATNPLFIGARKGSLTPHGRELLAMCEELITRISRLEKMQGPSSQPARTILIGTVELAALTWMTRFVSKIREDYPDLNVQVRVDLSASLHKMVEARQIDLAIIPDIYPSSKVRKVSLKTVEFGWFCAPNAFPKNTIVPLQELAKTPVIGQGEASVVTAIATQLFAQIGREPKWINGGNNILVLASLVEAGFGISYLPIHLFRENLKRGALQLVRTDWPQPSVDYCASFLKDPTNAACIAIADLARQSSYNSPNGK